MRFQWKEIFLKSMIMTAVIVAAATSGLAAPSEETPGENAPLQLKSFTVTAKKVEQDAQDVSASMSVVDGVKLDELGFTNLRDLPMLVPNLGMQQIGTHTTEFNYRGIGGVTTMAKTWNINVDGVTIPYVGIDTLFDVERIEVMRSSQAALYGRNTHAGVINIVTRKPTDEIEAEAEGSYGSFNSRMLIGSLSGPLGEKVKYRLAFKHEATDGYMESDVYGDDDTDWSDQVKGSGKLLFEPGENTDISLSVMADNYSGPNDGWANIAAGKKYDSTSNFRARDEGGLLSTNLTMSHDFGSMLLTSITAYSNSRYATGVDMDVSPVTLVDLADYRETYNTFTQEVRLNGGKGTDLRWLTGLFFLAEKTDYTTQMRFATPGGIMTDASNSTVDTYGAAWFGQVAYDITSALEIEGSLRLDVERRDWEFRDVETTTEHSEAHTWFAPLPSLTLTYKFNPDHRAYATVARGYRSGDYIANEVMAGNIGENHVVDPEFTLTYELGYKALAFDKRLRFNASTFWVDWTDMQVAAVIGGTQVRDNAGRAHSYGFEGEVSWLAAKGLNIFASAGWLNAEFDSYDGHPGGNPAGNKIPNTNEYSIGAGVNYTHDSGLFGSAIVTRFGPKYMEELNIIKQDPYTLANAKVGYRSDMWNIAVFADNLLDESYLLRAYQVGPGMQPGRYSKPRSYGLQAGCTFTF